MKFILYHHTILPYHTMFYHMPILEVVLVKKNEPLCEKTGFRGFRPSLTQTGLYSHRRAGILKFWLYIAEESFSIHEAKTKELITLQLICAFVFA